MRVRRRRRPSSQRFTCRLVARRAPAPTVADRRRTAPQQVRRRAAAGTASGIAAAAASASSAAAPDGRGAGAAGVDCSTVGVTWTSPVSESLNPRMPAPERSAHLWQSLGSEHEQQQDQQKGDVDRIVETHRVNQLPKFPWFPLLTVVGSSTSPRRFRRGSLLLDQRVRLLQHFLLGQRHDRSRRWGSGTLAGPTGRSRLRGVPRPARCCRPSRALPCFEATGARLYAPTPVFSSTEASARNVFSLLTGKTNVGFATGVPPSDLIAEVIAATCSAPGRRTSPRSSWPVPDRPTRRALSVVEVGRGTQRKSEVENFDVPLSVSASALETNGPTKAFRKRAPVASAPRRMKPERVRPLTSRPLELWGVIDLSGHVLIPLVTMVSIQAEERLDRRQDRFHRRRLGKRAIRGERLLYERAER